MGRKPKADRTPERRAVSRPRLEIDPALAAEWRGRIEQAQKWAEQHGLPERMRELRKLKASLSFGEQEQERLREIGRLLRDEPQELEPKPKRNKGGQPRKLAKDRITKDIAFLKRHPDMTMGEAMRELGIPDTQERTFRRHIWSKRND